MGVNQTRLHVFFSAFTFTSTLYLSKLLGKEIKCDRGEQMNLKIVEHPRYRHAAHYQYGQTEKVDLK